MSITRIDLKLTETKELCVEYLENNLPKYNFCWSSLDTEKIIKKLSESEERFVVETWSDSGERCSIIFRDFDYTYIFIEDKDGYSIFSCYSTSGFGMKEILSQFDAN
jgi:hypothetical protein